MPYQRRNLTPCRCRELLRVRTRTVFCSRPERFRCLRSCWETQRAMYTFDGMQALFYFVCWRPLSRSDRHALGLLLCAGQVGCVVTCLRQMPDDNIYSRPYLVCIYTGEKATTKKKWKNNALLSKTEQKSERACRQGIEG